MEWQLEITCEQRAVANQLGFVHWGRRKSAIASRSLTGCGGDGCGGLEAAERAETRVGRNEGLLCTCDLVKEKAWGRR